MKIYETFKFTLTLTRTLKIILPGSSNNLHLIGSSTTEQTEFAKVTKHPKEMQRSDFVTHACVTDNCEFLNLYCIRLFAIKNRFWTYYCG